MEYVIEVYMDGRKSENVVGSGIVIFIDKHLTFQLKYKLAERCSNYQVEQIAIAKALEKKWDLHKLQRNQRSIHSYPHRQQRITRHISEFQQPPEPSRTN